MYMPEDDTDSVAMFVTWLYRQPLPIVKQAEVEPKKAARSKKVSFQEFGPITFETHEKQVKQKMEEENAKRAVFISSMAQSFARFYKLYFFAEKLDINDLMNKSMDEIREALHKHNMIPTTKEVKEVYANTKPASLLRKFCINAIAWNNRCTSYDAGVDQVLKLHKEIPEFGRDMYKFLLREYDRKVDYMSEDYGNSESDPRMPDSEQSLGDCAFHDHGGKGEAGCHYEWKCRCSLCDWRDEMF